MDIFLIIRGEFHYKKRELVEEKREILLVFNTFSPVML